MTALSGIIQSRRGTAAQWTSANPTLAAGEAGYETDTGALKMGNGSTAWTSLGYVIGKWISFTPSWTNITLGSSTNVGKYRQDGKLVQFKAKITTGASFAITGVPRLTLPVTAASAVTGTEIRVYMLDAGTAVNLGTIEPTTASTTATGDLVALNANGTYVGVSNLSSSVPFTWATSGDILEVAGSYEAA